MGNSTNYIVRTFARNYRWIDVADLAQEAALAILSSKDGYRTDGGASRQTYYGFAVRAQLSVYVIKRTSPVTAGRSQIRRKLAGVRGVDIREWAKNAVCHHDGEEGIDRRRAISTINQLIDSMPDGWLARQVLLGEKRPGQVAREAGVAKRRVARAAREARAVLSMCEELRFYAE